MKSSASSLNNKNIIWIICILIIVSALTALFAVKNIKISPDSMRFGIVSQQIMSGNGIRVPLIRLEDNYVPVNGTIPFLDQMPLMPLLLALLGGITPHNYLAAQIINSICHVAIAVFTFLLMTSIYDNKGAALLTGILVVFSYPILRLSHHIWNEPLFISLTLAAMYYLTLARNSSYRQYSRSIIVAGICASAAILTRNAGIALIPVFFWEAVVSMKNKRPESKYNSTILAILLPLITAASMFIRNFVLSGSFRGFNQASPERSYLRAVTGTIEMIFQQFQLGRSAVILIVGFMLISTLYILTNANVRKEIVKVFNSGMDLTLIFMFSYTSLICLTMAKQQWRFELRYMSPLVPFLFMSFVFLTVFIWERVRFKSFSRLSLAGMIISLGIISSGTFYKTYLNLNEFSPKQSGQYSILDSCIYKWVKENYAGNTMIATNRPFHLSFFGGYSTVALPHKRYNPTIHVPEDMDEVLPNQMSNFGSHILALFFEVEEQYEGSYLTGLFNKRESNESFEIVHECSDGVIYNLKEESGP